MRCRRRGSCRRRALGAVGRLPSTSYAGLRSGRIYKIVETKQISDRPRGCGAASGHSSRKGGATFGGGSGEQSRNAGVTPTGRRAQSLPYRCAERSCASRSTGG